MGHHKTISQERIPLSRRTSLWTVLQPWGGYAFPSCHTPRSSGPMMPALAPNATSESRKGHFSEYISRVLSFPKSHDRDVCRVREWGAFTTLASTAASIRGVGGLIMANTCATSAVTSTTTSIAATPTRSLRLCNHRHLNSGRPRALRSRKTGRHTPYVTVPD